MPRRLFKKIYDYCFTRKKIATAKYLAVDVIVYEVRSIEELFIDWSPGDVRWKMLAEELGLSNLERPINRPSQLIPFIKFEIDGLECYYDPTERIRRPSPQTSTSTFTTKNLVVSAVQFVTNEVVVLKKVNKLIGQLRHNSTIERESALRILEKIESFARKCKSIKKNLSDALEKYTSSVEKYTLAVQSQSFSVEKLNELREAARRQHHIRMQALMIVVSTPGFPPTKEASTAIAAYEDAQNISYLITDQVLKQAEQVDIATTKVAEKTVEKSNARSSLDSVVVEAEKREHESSDILMDARKLLHRLAFPSCSHDDLKAHCKQYRLDIYRVLKYATTEKLWCLVPASQHEEKIKIESRISAAKNEIEEHLMGIAVLLSSVRREYGFS